MKLNLGLIYDAFDADSIDFAVGNLDSPLTLSWVFLLIFDEPVISDALYVTLWTDLAVFSSNIPKHIICVGGNEDTVRFFEDNKITGLIFSEKSNLMTVFNKVQKTFIRYDNLERELLAAMLADASTQNMLNCCAKFFEGHIMLFSSYDSGFMLLEHSNIYEPLETDAYWKDISEGKRGNFGMNPIEKKKSIPKHPDKYPKATFHEKTERYNARFITAFDYLNLRFATLIVMGITRPLTSRHHWLVDYVTNIIHPVITKRYNSSLNVRNNARAALTVALHHAQHNGPSAFSNVKSNLSQLRWDKSDNYRVVLISLPPECRNISHYLYNYEHVFSASYFNCIALHYEDLICILLRGDACNITSQQLETLESTLELDYGRCGIGTVFCDFSLMAYQVNLTILTMHTNVEGNRILYYSDILFEHVIKSVNSIVPLQAICHSEAVRLHKYDLENGTEHLSTLETYIKCNNSPLKAAKKMFIHKNTMTYRLKSIEKIVNLDLNDPDERLNILLSSIALRILQS